MTIYQNLIAGEWVGSDASNNISPSDTNDVVGSYAQGTADDAKQAIAAAKAAFPKWSQSGILCGLAVSVSIGRCHGSRRNRSLIVESARRSVG